MGRRSKTAILAALLIICALAAGCGPWGAKQSRRDIYVNLMTPIQQSHYLMMEAVEKPASLRLAYLQEIGVYQKWAEQPKNMQDAILRREVLEGMTPLQVRMAWGDPVETRDATLPAERAEGHTKTVWDYGLPTGKSDTSNRSVCFFDDTVLWVRRSR